MFVDAFGQLERADVTNPNTWMSFETAATHAWSRSGVTTYHVDKYGREITQDGFDIGLVLHEGAGFACVDMDVKDAENAPGDEKAWTTREQFERYYIIMQTLGTYAEVSHSGKGLHVWVRGSIGKGVRRDGVEVYSQERYIICTGRVAQTASIEYKQEILDSMTSQMRAAAQTEVTLDEVEPEEDDWYVLGVAAEAGNQDKFLALWGGKWQALGFPSQSEADLALMSMFAFYSKSNAQCRRLFRDSELGKREKAQKNDVYLNRTLQIIRRRMHAEQAIDMRALDASAEAVMRERQKALAQIAIDKMQSNANHSKSVPAMHSPDQPPVAPQPVPGLAVVTMASPVDKEVLDAKSELAWPPGMLGRVAQFIYRNSVRPVLEVSVVSALGLAAGLCGKAWHIPQSGLNLYITLVARSAVGKEALNSGISAIISSCSKKNPMFHKYVDFAEYASGPALVKACAANQCFLNISSEWGRRLKRMAVNETDGPLATLRTQMTSLYQKSGPQSMVGGITYSNADNNIASVKGVSYSMIGETTPRTFFESLTETMMEDGFLSRFLIVEYNGARPAQNLNQILEPDENLVDYLNSVSFAAEQRISSGTSQLVARTEDAAKLMWSFEQECDAKINSSDDEAFRQMWNRGALKMLRISAILAVLDNFNSPCITLEHAQWAHSIVMHDIKSMMRKIEEGDVGNGDGTRERKMVEVLRKYLVTPPAPYLHIGHNVWKAGIVPKSFFNKMLRGHSAFAQHKLGANIAISSTIASAVEAGYLMEVDKAKMAEAHNVFSRCYRILNLPNYSEQYSS